MLTAWSASALVGPRVLTKVREQANEDAVTDLALRCDPSTFEKVFGTPLYVQPDLVKHIVRLYKDSALKRHPRQ